LGGGEQEAPVAGLTNNHFSAPQYNRLSIFCIQVYLSFCLSFLISKVNNILSSSHVLDSGVLVSNCQTENILNKKEN
jgi:hypothetical protein